MKEIYINADDYNTDSIKTIQGNNNAEVYKLYLQYDNEKIDLTGKTVNLAFLRVGSTDGDIIENLNVTNAKEGEITLKITNKLTKKNGTYSCQLAILGEGDFLEHTATFTLTVENNIFSDITKAIADSKDFTYLENILDKASKLSEKLKENTSTATNANSNLEANITEANNINSKLLENTSAATSLNKNLESNIDLAKEVKETIKDLDTKNTEATSNIGQLTDLNAKAEELSNNIQQALPFNSELIKNTESAKVANTNLLATNQEATTKNTELQASLEKTKEFIEGLDGSQNIPQLRLDVTELQNGLKSNQSLSYTGNSINANNTLEGRTEGMRIGGRTLLNLVSNTPAKNAGNVQIEKLLKSEMFKVGTTYTVNIPNRNNKQIIIVVKTKDGVTKNINFSSTTNTFTVEEDYPIVFRLTLHTTNGWDVNNDLTNADKSVIVEGNNIIIDNYFEGLKSFGEQEGNKISILSHNKNLFDFTMYKEKIKNIQGVIIKEDGFIADCSINGSVGNNLLKTTQILKGYFKPDTQYFFDYKLAQEGRFSGDFIYNYTDGTVSSCRFASQVGKTIDYIGFTFMTQAYGGRTIFSDIMLIEGSNKHIYEPYKEDKKDILIKEPLRSVGGIQDVVYEDNGQVKIDKYVKQYTFTGDETITIYDDKQTDTICFRYYDSNQISSWEDTNKLICNSLKTIGSAIYQSNVEGCSSDKFAFLFRIAKSKLSTLDANGFKAWLKANPTTIVYQLATPTTEIVENCVDIDLDTYQEKTYFNILNSLPGTLDFKVPSNITSIVQSNSKAINELYNLIDTLVLPNILQNTTDIEMLKLEKLK
ncbi:BppU family phage baseplate upper protein [Clostridium perfringens]|nr:BppU family phage baseplate upper protein [Clostridium perfringens]